VQYLTTELNKAQNTDADEEKTEIMDCDDNTNTNINDIESMMADCMGSTASETHNDQI
jgi:hypothetical protein